MPNKSFLPNINLRVFRREKTDMSLIFNCSEILSLLEDIKPAVYINGNKLNTVIQKSTAKDTTANDIYIFIDYKTNNLNADDKYTVELRFAINSVDFIQYYIDVEGCGIIPSLKDNKNMFVQSFAYDPKKKRWAKPSLQENDVGNSLMVVDTKVISLLEEIKELLNKLLNK